MATVFEKTSSTAQWTKVFAGVIEGLALASSYMNKASVYKGRRLGCFDKASGLNVQMITVKPLARAESCRVRPSLREYGWEGGRNSNVGP